MTLLARQLTAGDYLVIDCFRILDPNDFTRVYNAPFLKKYFTALCKKQWSHRHAWRGFYARAFDAVHGNGQRAENRVGFCLFGYLYFDGRRTDLEAVAKIMEFSFSS